MIERKDLLFCRVYRELLLIFQIRQFTLDKDCSRCCMWSADAITKTGHEFVFQFVFKGLLISHQMNHI